VIVTLAFRFTLASALGFWSMTVLNLLGALLVLGDRNEPRLARICVAF